MAQVRKGYADTPLGQIYYREAGSGLPVVFLHESPLSSLMFEPALPLLGQRVHAVAMDTPGYGSSDPPHGPIPMSGYVERLGLFLDAMGFDQVALAGDHTGGSIGIHFAVTHPERVKALVVSGCPLFTTEEKENYLKNLLVTFDLSRDGSHLTPGWHFVQDQIHAQARLEILHAVATEFLSIVERYDWALRAVFADELDTVLPRLSCPTFFFTTRSKGGLWERNEPSVALTPNAEGLVLDLPYAQLAMSDPEVYRREVISFLERANYLQS